MSKARWKAAYAAARKALRKSRQPEEPTEALACLTAREKGDPLANLERGFPRLIRLVRQRRRMRSGPAASAKG